MSALLHDDARLALGLADAGQSIADAQASLDAHGRLLAHPDLRAVGRELLLALLALGLQTNELRRLHAHLSTGGAIQ